MQDFGNNAVNLFRENLPPEKTVRNNNNNAAASCYESAAVSSYILTFLIFLVFPLAFTVVIYF